MGVFDSSAKLAVVERRDAAALLPVLCTRSTRQGRAKDDAALLQGKRERAREREAERDRERSRRLRHNRANKVAGFSLLVGSAMSLFRRCGLI